MAIRTRSALTSHSQRLPTSVAAGSSEATAARAASSSRRRASASVSRSSDGVLGGRQLGLHLGRVAEDRLTVGALHVELATQRPVVVAEAGDRGVLGLQFGQLPGHGAASARDRLRLGAGLGQLPTQLVLLSFELGELVEHGPIGVGSRVRRQHDAPTANAAGPPSPRPGRPTPTRPTAAAVRRRDARRGRTRGRTDGPDQDAPSGFGRCAVGSPSTGRRRRVRARTPAPTTARRPRAGSAGRRPTPVRRDASPAWPMPSRSSPGWGTPPASGSRPAGRSPSDRVSNTEVTSAR